MDVDVHVAEDVEMTAAMLAPWASTIQRMAMPVHLRMNAVVGMGADLAVEPMETKVVATADY